MKQKFIKTNFVRFEGPKARANKTGNKMIFILIFVENWLKYDAIHYFSVWLKTGSNPKIRTEKNRNWNALAHYSHIKNFTPKLSYLFHFSISLNKTEYKTK